MNNRTIAWISGSLTLLLVLFSFILSYKNLVALAAEKGLPVPALFPWVVEFAVVVFSVGVLRRSLQGERAVWGWSLVIGSSLTAMVFNVVHAQNDLISRVMHAIPSIFMLLSFETFLSQLKESARRSQVFNSLSALNSELSDLQTTFEQQQQSLNSELADKRRQLNTLADSKQLELNKLERQIEQATVQLARRKLDIKQVSSVQSGSIEQAKEVQLEQINVTIEQRRVELVHILKREGDIGATALAERLNTSRGTVYNDLQALDRAGIVQKNGHGWTVLNREPLPLLAGAGA